jgi:hypothetical protein
MTTFIILNHDDENGWVPLGEQEGRSPKVALAQVLNRDPDMGGGWSDHFAVVPSRNWHTYTVAVETQTKVVLK